MLSTARNWIFLHARLARNAMAARRAQAAVPVPTTTRAVLLPKESTIQPSSGPPHGPRAHEHHPVHRGYPALKAGIGCGLHRRVGQAEESPTAGADHEERDQGDRNVLHRGQRDNGRAEHDQQGRQAAQALNNVGDYRPLVRFHDSSPESWQAMYDVNLHHVLLVTGVNIPVDGGTLAGGGWFYSPGAGRFVNRPTGLQRPSGRPQLTRTIASG